MMITLLSLPKRPRSWSAVLLLAGVMLAGCGAQSEPARGTRLAQVEAAKAPLHTPLDDYIARPEPEYKWEKTATQDMGVVVTYDLRLTSQTWQGKPWTHRVQVFRPAEVRYPDIAMVVVSYGSGTPGETLVGQLAANATGATVVNVFNVPNQPLYGLREDALIAYTFGQYLETNDATWPLLFPMTKSVVKAMDAVGEFSRKEFEKPITKFVIGGGSKRGWTSWLTAAVDARVAGIVPTVYDNLNLAKQMPHQLEVWGEYSPQIQDYTRLGLQAKMATPRGQQLAMMVDPWTYRERLKLPKLIMNATNDEYWPLDAYTLYKDDLQGPTDVYYVPNSGHMMTGREAAAAANGAMWFKRLAAGKSSPKFELQVDATEADGARSATLVCPTLLGSPQVSAARVWVARAATRDFRKAEWQEAKWDGVIKEEGAAAIAIPKTPEGMKYTALIGELELAGSPWTLRLSTPVQILGQ